MPRERIYSDEDLINYLKLAYTKLGCLPTIRRYDEFHSSYPESPCHITYKSRYGSWSNALRYVFNRTNIPRNPFLSRYSELKKEKAKEIFEKAVSRAASVSPVVTIGDLAEIGVSRSYVSHSSAAKFILESTSLALLRNFPKKTADKIKMLARNDFPVPPDCHPSVLKGREILVSLVKGTFPSMSHASFREHYNFSKQRASQYVNKYIANALDHLASPR